MGGKDDFDGAVKILAGMPKAEKNAIPLDDMTEIYALYKSATVGACTGGRPNIWDLKARKKYDAWSGLGAIDKDEAKRRYCLLADKHSPGWRAAPGSGTTGKLLAAKSRFTKSKPFVKAVKDVFLDVDNDKSGKLDGDEVYIAVLKLYIKIQGFCKGAEPPTRVQVDDMFNQFTNGVDNMSFEQFSQFCEYLGAQIAGRVGVQMFLVNVVAPVLALCALFVWDKVMHKIAPDWFEWFEETVPMPIVVTVGVGTCVSLFVPPLMKLVDRYILKSADDATPDSPTLGLVGGAADAGKRSVAAVGGAVGGAVTGVAGAAKGATSKVGAKIGLNKDGEEDGNGGCCGGRSGKAKAA